MNDEKQKTGENETTQKIDLNNTKDDVNDEGVTREINLDELYDGVINNTVVIDPVTNDEVLLPSKKPSYTLIGAILAILILLVLYYVNNKTDLGRTTKNVEPKTTTSSVSNTDNHEVQDGVLTCTYNSKGDAETQTVTFVANYKNSVVINSNFNYVVMSNLDTTSAVIEDLKSQYENFYINNAAVMGNNITFEKNEKGFTFNAETNYNTSDFDKVMLTNGQTILYVKPEKSDTYEILQKAYTDKGFSCVISKE